MFWEGREARWSGIIWASHSRLEGLSREAAGARGAWTRGLWMPCGPKPWDLQKPPGNVQNDRFIGSLKDLLSQKL